MELQFTVGTHVRYIGTGVCEINRIEDVDFSGIGDTRSCYVLVTMRNPCMTVYVPLDSENCCAKIKPLLTKETIDALLEAEADPATKLTWIEDRKERTALFRKLLSGGDERDLVQLIRCIEERKAALRANGKHLALSDETTHKEALRMLEDEFTYSLQLSPEDTATYVREKLGI